MVQPQDRAAARAARENTALADPFGQLEQAIAQHEAGGQIALEFDGDKRCPLLVRDIALDVISSQIAHIRVFAKMRSEKLLFENLCCGHCGSTEVIREIEDARWFWECRNCAKPVSDVPAIQQMTRLFDELRAASSNQPSQDFDKGIEVFSLEDINNLAENFQTVSSDEHASARVKATLKRLIDIGNIRPYVVPNPAWRGQLDELREHFPNFINAIDEVLEPSLAISAAGGRCRPAPMLLVGPPGVGKSYFSSLIASVLKTPQFKVAWPAPPQDLAWMDWRRTGGTPAQGRFSKHWHSAGPAS